MKPQEGCGLAAVGEPGGGLADRYGRAWFYTGPDGRAGYERETGR